VKLIKIRLGLLEFFEPSLPLWWFGKNECVMGEEHLFKENWFVGIVLIRKYSFDNNDEMQRVARRVVWGEK